MNKIIDYAFIPAFGVWLCMLYVNHWATIGITLFMALCQYLGERN